MLKWPNELTACINKLNKQSKMPNILDEESKQTNWKNNNQKDDTENKQTAKNQPKRYNGKQTRRMIGLRAWVVHQVDAIIGIVEALGLGWVGLDLKFVWVTDSKHKWDPLPPAGTLLEKGHGTHSKDTKDKYNDKYMK